MKTRTIDLGKSCDEITQKLVRELFIYRDGNLYWAIDKGPNARIGDLAGYLRKDEYRGIKINYKNYRAHRLIFLYHNGYIPLALI